MNVGDSTELGGYTFRLAALRPFRGSNYQGVRADVEVTRGTRSLATIHPEKRLYVVQNMPMTEAALDIGLLRHLYVSLGDPIGEGTWTLRIYVKPLIGWIWGGCLLMGLGGLLAALDRRYRLAAGARARAAPEAASAPG
jgi:cytochrome c-type biogenesis protein CcmF